MKKIALLIVFLSIAFIAPAQEKADKNTASFELGSGLNFSFNEDYLTIFENIFIFYFLYLFFLNFWLGFQME